MVNFSLARQGYYSDLLKELQVTDFLQACNYVAQLPYGRNADRGDFSLVISEEKGTCSSKHALLAQVAVEQGITTVELVCGIFLMGPDTHPQLQSLFQHYNLQHIPEAHCYLRVNGIRYDFTTHSADAALFSSRIVREQRIEPHQVAEWKPMIHKHFLGGWLKRNPEIPFSEEELWHIREEIIAAL